MFSPGTLEEALATLGEVLASRDQRFDVVAIGGGALHLLGTITRPTKDIDIVALVVDGALETSKPFPDALVQACADVARALDLSADWMNGGPTSLLQFGLPDGMLARAERRDELRAAAKWTFTHDPSEGYRMLCRDLLEHLGAGGAIDEG